jgi:spore coat protein U-like protein
MMPIRRAGYNYWSASVMKRLSTATAIALASCWMSPAAIGQVGGFDIHLRAEVLEGCVLSTPEGDWLMDFGTYESGSEQPVDAEFRFDVLCSVGGDAETNVALRLSNRFDHNANRRTLVHSSVVDEYFRPYFERGEVNGNLIPDDVRLWFHTYHDSARTMIWDWQNKALPPVSGGDGANRYVIYGRIDGGQSSQPGTHYGRIQIDVSVQ